MLLKIDRTSPTPLYQQVINEIRKLIEQGTIEVNNALPSTRSLAKKLGINRSTLVHAYEELQSLGYLKSSPGSYTTVQKRRKEAAYDSDRNSLISWEKASTEQGRELYKTYLHYSPENLPFPEKEEKNLINLSRLDLDHRLFPVKELKRCINRVLFDQGPHTLQYGSPRGYAPLREYIAKRLRLHGISVSEQEILITNGAQQAIDLVIRLLALPDRKVAIEAPTYANVIPLLRFNGVETVAIPMRQNGMDLAYLKNILETESVSFVYTIPNFQNPTGITTSHTHRDKLLSICMKHRVPIVEDGFEEDMKYFGKVPLPIKSIDDKNIVIYLGTFSKALFPGLRIGWITADRECINRLTALKRFSDLSSSNLVQSVLHYFCKHGYYDLQLRRLHRIFRRRMPLALKTMEECLPPTATWTRPAGGYTIWVKIPRKMSERILSEYMADYGVIVSPGGYYFPQKASSEYFRVSIASLNEEEIREGIARLGKALHSLG